MGGSNRRLFKNEQVRLSKTTQNFRHCVRFVSRQSNWEFSKYEGGVYWLCCDDESM